MAKRPKVYRLPNGDVRVSYRFFGKRVWETMTKEQYETLYGGSEYMPKYGDLPVVGRGRR